MPAVYRPAPSVSKTRFQTAPFGPAKSAPHTAKKAEQEIKPAAEVVPLDTTKAAPEPKKA